MPFLCSRHTRQTTSQHTDDMEADWATQVSGMLAGGFGSMYKDLPRLIRRVHVAGPDGTVLFDGTKPGRETSVLALIGDLLTQLVTVFELEADAEAVCLRLTKFVAMYEGSRSLMGPMQTIFEELIGLDTRTARSLKLVHQGLTMSAMYYVKTQLSSFFFSKDIAEARGWQVHVVLHDSGCVSVSHIRTERLGNPAFPGDQFECEWQAQCIMNTAIDTVLATRVEVTNVDYPDSMSKEAREAARRDLSCGHLLVSC